MVDRRQHSDDDAAILAVDAGGSRCRLVLEQGSDRWQAKAGPANAFSDFQGAVEAVLAALAKVSEGSGLSMAALRNTPAYVAMAGVTGPDVAARVADALPLENVVVAEDRAAALQGAFGDDDGVLVHCGTGSFFAARLGGKPSFAGGWGMLLGDEASAQWIGRRALAASVRAEDGFGVHSPLTEHLLAQMGGTDDVLTFVAGASPSDFGALATLVTTAAENADPTARSILHEGASYVADGLAQMGWKPGTPICLTGGVGPIYAAYLGPEMADALVSPLGAPIDGALALARRYAKHMVTAR